MDEGGQMMSEYVGLKQGKVHDRREMSEYYCGGCGYPVTDHDSYCRECGGRLHEGIDKSRWHELFGSPERAAETLKRMDVDACNWCVNSSGNPEDCRACPYKYDYYGCYLPEKFSMLEWLKSEVVE